MSQNLFSNKELFFHMEAVRFKTAAAIQSL